VREYEAITLPTGYSLDLVGDPCVVTLCRSDGTVVARFTYATDPEQIRRAAEEDGEGGGGEGGTSIHPIEA
jgi:hypothetical protein